MAIQSQAQIADNLFVVTAVEAWSGDPSRNIVTLRALVPGANTNAVKAGQSYALSDSTLTSNNNGGVIVALGPSPGGSYPVA